MYINNKIISNNSNSKCEYVYNPYMPLNIKVIKNNKFVKNTNITFYKCLFINIQNM